MWAAEYGHPCPNSLPGYSLQDIFLWWLCSLPVAFLIRYSMFLASITNWLELQLHFHCHSHSSTHCSHWFVMVSITLLHIFFPGLTGFLLKPEWKTSLTSYLLHSAFWINPAPWMMSRTATCLNSSWNSLDHSCSGLRVLRWTWG